VSAPQQKLTIVPSTKHEVNKHIKRLHRHNKTVAGGRIFLACLDEVGEVRGVAVAGRPVARMSDDRFTLEVNRVATDGCPNANSALYGRARRIAQAYGFTRVMTYTLPSESGVSLRAAGFVRVAEGVGGGSWERDGRKRPGESHVKTEKVRWEWSVWLDELRLIREKLEPAFCPATASPSTPPGATPSSTGHCAAVAFLLRERFGGQYVSTKVDGVSHWFNRVGGRDVDLTGDQFGFDRVRVALAGGLHEETRVRRPDEMNTETRARGVLLGRNAGLWFAPLLRAEAA
jgi:hypothetical protein